MRNCVLNRRRAISTVLTTVIILVASVVLGASSGLYGTSLFQTSVQQDSIVVLGMNLWVNATDSLGDAWGTAGVRNNGKKIVSIETIQVRGVTVPLSNWYFDKDQTRVSVINFQGLYEHTGTSGAGTLMKDTLDTGDSVTISCTTPDNTTLEIDFGDVGTKETLCLMQASAPVALNPGDRMIVYPNTTR
ncbi:hypothetical protein [Nitrosopumilus piranensis]|uniref:Archaeal Type IV pilin N-terminal domain-containing protein n=1 Tax=Nitrosopumilus piranensis TaxID=1582439 RepID=A0A0C5BXH6_9ARCH|nr:hypothetical protein [Nitrosopumilus piranensis]AJM91645.1 conserved exported protein of unknown function [Nitrosopumilus piranensis]